MFLGLLIMFLEKFVNQLHSYFWSEMTHQEEKIYTGALGLGIMMVGLHDPVSCIPYAGASSGHEWLLETLPVNCFKFDKKLKLKQHECKLIFFYICYMFSFIISLVNVFSNLSNNAYVYVSYKANVTFQL